MSALNSQFPNKQLDSKPEDAKNFAEEGTIIWNQNLNDMKSLMLQFFHQKQFIISLLLVMLALGTALKVVYANASGNFCIPRRFSGTSIGGKKVQWKIFLIFD